MAEKKWGEFYKTPDGRIIRYIPLHAGQQAIWDSKARFLGYISGKGSGKSSFAPIWLDNEIRKDPKAKFIVCAPSNKIIDQGIFPEFKLTFNSPFNDLRGEWNETKRVYTLSTGGTVWFRSLDDPETVNGIHAKAIVVDELGLLPHSAWTILESRVAKHQGRILATTTPYAKFKWLQKEFVERAKTDANYFVVTVPSKTNPGFSNDEYERLKASLPPWKFAQDYDGLFVSPAGLVYPELAACVVDMPASGLPAGQLVGGIDPGFNDRNPFVALAGVLDDQDCLWLCYEHFIRCGKDKFWETEDHAQYLPAGVTWYCDSADPSVIQKLKRLGHLTRQIKKFAGSIEVGIDQVTARIRTGRLKIIKDTCERLLEEAQEYRYPSPDEHLGTNPVGHDHCCDALRYVVMSIDRKPKQAVAA